MNAGTYVIVDGRPALALSDPNAEAVIEVLTDSGLESVPREDVLTASQFLQQLHDTEQSDLATLTEWERVQYHINRRNMTHAQAFNSVV